MSSPESYRGPKEEKEPSSPLHHLAIAVEPHQPWNEDQIAHAGIITSHIRDIASMLGVEQFTIYMDDLNEAELVATAMYPQTEHFNTIQFSFQPSNERQTFFDAFKHMTADKVLFEENPENKAPFDLTDEIFDSYFPKPVDLLIISGEDSDSFVPRSNNDTQGEHDEDKQVNQEADEAKKDTTSKSMRLRGTILSTAYAEFATVEESFLDFTPDILLKKIAEYQQRKRKFGEVPKEDQEF